MHVLLGVFSPWPMDKYKEGFALEWKTIVLSLLGLFGLYLFGTIFARPLVLLGKLGLSLVVGGVLLALVNFVRSGLGIYITMNPVYTDYLRVFY